MYNRTTSLKKNFLKLYIQLDLIDVTDILRIKIYPNIFINYHLAIPVKLVTDCDNNALGRKTTPQNDSN